MPINNPDKSFYLGRETATLAEIIAAPSIDHCNNQQTALPNVLAGLPKQFGGENHWGLDYGGSGIDIQCKGHINLDYRRTASVYVVLLDGAPIAITVAAGRSECDHRQTFVLNPESIKVMIARLAAIELANQMQGESLEIHDTTAEIHLPKCGYSTVKLGESHRDADWGY